MPSVREIIAHFEGFSSRLYRCTSGKLTIGYGYNIEDRGLPEDICEELLGRDIADINRYLRTTYDWYEELDDARKKAIISMVYQLGKGGFAKFEKTIEAIKAKNWEAAYVNLLDSKWARQTPLRAKRTAMVIRTGDESWFFKKL